MSSLSPGEHSSSTVVRWRLTGALAPPAARLDETTPDIRTTVVGENVLIRIFFS